MEIRKIFKMMDKDSSRSMDFGRITNLLAHEFPWTGGFVPELVEKLRESERDKEGHLDFHEFLMFFKRLLKYGKISADDEHGDADEDEESFKSGVRKGLKKDSFETT